MRAPPAALVNILKRTRLSDGPSLAARSSAGCFCSSPSSSLAYSCYLSLEHLYRYRHFLFGCIAYPFVTGVRYVRIVRLTYHHLGSQSALSAARSFAQERAQRASRSRKEAKAYTCHGEDDMAARSSALEHVEVSVVALDEVGAQCSTLRSLSSSPCTLRGCR